jgi:1-deoxy-D-xylulose-5-phosphate reductoisomerase
MEVGRKGGTYPAVLCGADEVAVDLFLSERIKFTDIPILVERALEKHKGIAHPAIEQILEADAWARQTVLQLAGDSQ